MGKGQSVGPIPGFPDSKAVLLATTLLRRQRSGVETRAESETTVWVAGRHALEKDPPKCEFKMGREGVSASTLVIPEVMVPATPQLS